MRAFPFARSFSVPVGKAYRRSIAGSLHADWVQRDAGNGRIESWSSWFSSRRKTITRKIIGEEKGGE